MSETQNTPQTPEQIASARATWINAGHDPAIFDAAVSGAAPVAPADQTPAVPVAPIQATPAGPDGFTDEQVAAARANWIKFGYDPAKFDAAVAAAPEETPPGYTPGTGIQRLTQAEADTLEATLRASGLTEDQVAAELQAHGYERDTRSPEQFEHDERWGFGREYKAEEYKINYRDAGILDQHTTETMAASQVEWRDLLTGFQISPAIGADLVERAIRTGQAFTKMDADQKTLWIAEQRAQGLRVAGSPEAVTERNRLAGVAITYAVQHGARASTIEALRQAGAFDDWFTIQTLANHGRALEGWLAGPKGSR